jgi:hypothetical protein
MGQAARAGISNFRWAFDHTGVETAPAQAWPEGFAPHLAAPAAAARDSDADAQPVREPWEDQLAIIEQFADFIAGAAR